MSSYSLYKISGDIYIVPKIEKPLKMINDKYSVTKQDNGELSIEWQLSEEDKRQVLKAIQEGD